MALTEENRHQLFQRLEELLGLEEASTLMELLPPVGWADVATKRDLDHLEERLDSKLDGLGSRLDRRFDRLDARIDGVESGLGARIDGAQSGLGARIDGVESRLGARIDGVESGLGARIDGAQSGLGARMDRLDARFNLFGAELRAELYRSQRNLAFGVIGANAAVTALLLTAFQVL